MTFYVVAHCDMNERKVINELEDGNYSSTLEEAEIRLNSHSFVFVKEDYSIYEVTIKELKEK